MAARGSLHALTPVNLLGPAQAMPELFEAVVSLYHLVLPNVSRRFLRKYLASSHVHTLVLLLPEAPDGGDDEEPDSDSESESEEEESSAHQAADANALTEASLTSPEASSHVLSAEALDTRKRLVGCVSYEYGNRLGQRLVQVCLLGTKLKYQRHGLGRKLVRALLEGQATPEHPEAAIAWADERAIPFFRRFGFSDDKILCSRYREISEPWEDSILMSAQLAPPIPPLSDAVTTAHWMNESMIEEQVDAWRHSRLLEYSKELALIESLRAEIRKLREKVVYQAGQSAYLSEQVRQLKQDKVAMQRELESYQNLASASAIAMSSTLPLPMSPSNVSSEQLSTWGPDHKQSLTPVDQPASSSKPAASGRAIGLASQNSRARVDGSLNCPETLTELKELFGRSKIGDESAPSARLQLRSYTAPPSDVAALLRQRYDHCRASLQQPELQLQLFYGAPRRELEDVLHNGFINIPSNHLGLEVYGRGWYFSKYAAQAHLYNGGSSCVLLALVAVGNPETVVRRDAGRGAPSSGFDSIVVPGRPLPSQLHASQDKKPGWNNSGYVQSMSSEYRTSAIGEEYVIFDGSQALPLFLIEYETEGL